MHESVAELISTSYEFDLDLVNPDVVHTVTSLTCLDLLESKKQACVTFGVLQLQGTTETLLHQIQIVQLAGREKRPILTRSNFEKAVGN